MQLLKLLLQDFEPALRRPLETTRFFGTYPNSIRGTLWSRGPTAKIARNRENHLMDHRGWSNSCPLLVLPTPPPRARLNVAETVAVLFFWCL
jgi:hypothetical protein